MKSSLLALGLCIVLAMTFGPAFSVEAQQAAGNNRPTPVVIALAKDDVFFDVIEGLGTLRANETITLMPTVTETVTAVNFEDGQYVEAGTILIEMTDGQEKAQLEQVRVAVDEARRQLTRVESLVKSSAASRALLDQQRRDYNAARARLAEIQSTLADHLIVAPFAGRLGMRNVSVGALMRPGEAITTLDDTSKMKLDFTVPSIHLTSLREGLSVTAKAREFGEKSFLGTISSVDGQIDPVSRSIMVRAVLPNDQLVLLPGLLMNVEIKANERKALVIPEKAAILEGERSYVFLLDESQVPEIVKKTEVEVGARRAGEVEILSGLNAGDKVVTHGTMNVRDGGIVSVMTTESGEDSLGTILDRSTQEKTKH
ncbi:MAG: hypothetical protein AUJ12_01155 [Alphaproteobacteria bacterium CG1_02_46_17]|nr:MAG: hypothetical protein AUJ12_01155 [Alphaproteobacteria bacterium CG1_02_46_17]